MSEQASEQLNHSSAWRVAEKFLQTHGRSTDGERLSAERVGVLMLGVWAGCRFALLDSDLALAMAALGNAQPGLAFESLRHGFASEFGEQMRELVHDVLYERGFTEAWAELVETATASGAVEAPQDVLRQRRDGGRDGQEGSRR